MAPKSFRIGISNSVLSPPDSGSALSNSERITVVVLLVRYGYIVFIIYFLRAEFGDVVFRRFFPSSTTRITSARWIRDFGFSDVSRQNRESRAPGSIGYDYALLRCTRAVAVPRRTFYDTSSEIAFHNVLSARRDRGIVGTRPATDGYRGLGIRSNRRRRDGDSSGYGRATARYSKFLFQF